MTKWRGVVLAACVAALFVGVAPSRAQSTLPEPIRKQWFDAVSTGQASVVQAMLSSGQVRVLDPIDNERNTALHLAAERCNAGLISLLLSRGARADLANKWNDTPARIAAVRCGAQSPAAVAFNPRPAPAGVATAPPRVAPPVPSVPGARSVESNTLACPARPEMARFEAFPLQVGEIVQFGQSGMYVRVTQDFDDDAGGFAVDLMLPGATIRGLPFRGPPVDAYRGPSHRLQLCGATYVVGSSWGHPYFGRDVEIQILTGPVSGF
jgi:hypothetical protein